MQEKWILGLLLAVLGCGQAEKPEFSPLVRLDAGAHDLAVAGIDSIRATDLAPGAAPARPVVEGSRAVREVHFLATYDRDVTAPGIGEATVKALADAGFAWGMDVTRREHGGEWECLIAYETRGSTGGLSLHLLPGDAPNRLELRYRVEEKLRDRPVDRTP